MSVEDKAKKIKLVVLDVDGVLTDGQIVTGSQGELCKHFDVKDGLGIKMLLGARLRELGVRDVFQGQSYKKGAFLDLIQARHLDASECACMGDDIPDLPVLQLVGLSCAPADAVDTVLKSVDFVSSRAGAVREMAEKILMSQGVWDDLIDRFYFHPDAPRFR